MEEHRKIDRLQAFFNNEECENVIRLFDKLDKLKALAEKAGKPTDIVMQMIGDVGDILIDVSSNHNKIASLTAKLDSMQEKCKEADLQASQWRYKYFQAKSTIDTRNVRDMGLKQETKLDFNSTL